MAGTKGPRRALAMDEEAGQYPIDHMLLNLASVMRDVVEQREGCGLCRFFRQAPWASQPAPSFVIAVVYDGPQFPLKKQSNLDATEVFANLFTFILHSHGRFMEIQSMGNE